MTHICHLFDEQAGFEQRVGVTQLLDRLGEDRFSFTVATMSPAAVKALAPFSGHREVLKLPAGLAPFSKPARARALMRRRPDVIHAWGVSAASTARMAGDTPLVVALGDPGISDRSVRMLRSVARDRHFAVACSSALMRRRLVEGGLPPELCVLLRPGVDFGFVSHCKQGSLRRRLGIEPGERVVIVPEPVTRRSGAFDGYWSATIRADRTARLRTIVPGDSPEEERIRRFAARAPRANSFISPGSRIPFEELICISDVMIIAPRGDVPTTSIAWAMAARVAVIGTAVPAVAEFISHKHNGLLVKPEPGRSLIAPLSQLIPEEAAQEKAAETAHGQAYKFFSVRRYADQFERLYQNVMNGVAPGEGISDPMTEG